MAEIIKSKILNFFLIFFFLLILISLTSAQERPEYNFGSVQPIKDFKVIPGNEITTKLYFYNIYGNKITHIKLSIAEAPKNWEAALNPEMHDSEYDIAGVLTTVQENLFVDPGGKAVAEPPKTAPKDYEYIHSKIGYIPAKAVELTIKVPKKEKIGKTFDLKIEATAFWMGQAGSVAIQQGRTFDYKITTVSEEFYERPVTGATTREIGKAGIVIGILAGVIALVGIVIFIFLRKQRLY